MSSRDVFDEQAAPVSIRARIHARLGPLRKPSFALFFVGYAISVTGSSMVPIALSFAVFQLGGGAGEVSAVLAVETIPMAVLLLIGGAVADRLPRRLVMMAADGVRCLSEGLLAVLLISHHATVPVMMVLAAIIGAGDAFFSPGRTGLIPQLTTAAELQSANAIISTVGALAAIIGPAGGGLLVGVAGPGWAIGFDAASYAVSAACLVLLRVPAQAVDPSESFLRQLVTGWTEFWSRKWLWIVVLEFALLHLLTIGPIFVLGPLSFKQVPHGATIWGGLLGALGAGALIGGLIALRVRPRRPLLMAIVVLLPFAVVPAALAEGVSSAVGLTAFFIGGVSLSLFGVLWSTTMQREVPPAVLSRVSAYDTFGSVCLLPAGYVLAAPMASALGLHGALWLAAGFSFLSILVVLASRSVRDLRAA